MTAPLSALSPSSVGALAAGLAQEHAGRLMQAGLLRDVADLTTWAQSGTNAEGWDEVDAWDAVQQICTALYSRAGEPGAFGGGPIDEGPTRDEPASPIETVLLAAWCRYLLALRTEVPVRALAALAGLRQQSVRNLASEGELTMHRGLVAPDEARRWLSGRGVPLP